MDSLVWHRREHSGVEWAPILLIHDVKVEKLGLAPHVKGDDRIFARRKRLVRARRYVRLPSLNLFKHSFCKGQIDERRSSYPRGRLNTWLDYYFTLRGEDEFPSEK